MSIINLRTKAAFGGVMGKDGRKAYVGGSYSGSTSSSGEGSQGSGKGYQGGSAAPGSAEAGKGGGGSQYKDDGGYTSTSNPTGTVTKKIREEQKQKVIDNLKASEISRFEPNKAINYLPFIGGARNILGTPLTKAGKTRMAKRRMEYINSLPPQQRRAMIERLGYAEDEEYDELDEYNLATQTYTDPKTGKVFGPVGPFNQEDVDFNFGRFDNVGTDYNLTGNPLSYVGENPIYGMDAYDIINYDGEFLKRYGQDLTNTGGGNETLPYIPGPGDTGDEGGEDTGPDYRFGTGQKVGADVTRGSYIFNQGGRVPRNMGGIMNAVPRQGYFLGKIVKGVGKAIGSVADAAGKVLKSDVGKMALLYGAGAMAGSYGLKGSLFSKGMFNPMNMKAGLFGANSLAMNKLGLGKMAANKGLLAKLGLTQGYGSFLPTWKGGIAAMTALPLLGIGTEAKQDPSLMSTRKDSGLIDPLTKKEGTPASMRENIELAKLEAAGDPDKLDALNRAYNNMLFTTKPYENYGLYANGGRIARAEGGLMNLGGMEKDYRAEGGFVPIGREEKADDVPARLSVNEFVFTADAVRNAGGGDIDKGAEVMENMMKNLENGGRVSEESQGNTGAQEMFSVSERIGEVI